MTKNVTSKSEIFNLKKKNQITTSKRKGPVEFTDIDNLILEEPF